MSEQPYTPRAGSKAEAAIAALTATKWLSKAELADEIDCELTSIDGNVKLAVDHGLIRRVARDGKAGFMLGGSDAPPQDDEAEPVKRAKPKKSAPAPKRAKAIVHKPAPATHPVNGSQAVGILEDGTIVIVDEQGHAMSLPPATARRVAELVNRTA